MAQPFFKSLEITGFRKFGFLSIKELGQVNLITGKNNVGKSSLLEALRLYASIGSPQVMWEILRERDELVDRSVAGALPRGGRGPAVWRLFHGDRVLAGVTDPIRIGPSGAPDSTLAVSIVKCREQTDDKGLKTLVETDDVQVALDDTTIPALSVKIGAVKRLLRLDINFKTHCRRWMLQPQSFLNLVIPCVSVTANGIRAKELERLWNRVALTEAEEEVVKSLRIVAPEVDDFSLLSTGSGRATSVRVKVQGRDWPVPLRSMGDGVNRLFGIGMSMVNARGGLLLIDEIENGIHYTALLAVWKFILRVARSLDVQVFATTHSSDCVTAFQQATKEDAGVEGVLTRLEIKDGEVVPSLYDEERLEKVIRAKIETR